MDKLTTLPAELLLLIAGAAPSLQAASRLCSVNRRMRKVWQGNYETIATNVLRNTVPAYEDAAKLAIAEARVAAPEGLRDGVGNFYCWVSRLLHNAQLAEETVAGLETYLRGVPADHYTRRFHFTSFLSAYYYVRQAVLSYGHPDQEKRFREELRAMPKKTKGWTIWELSFYIEGSMDERLQERHNMINAGWNGEEDPEEDFKFKPEWEYAMEMFDIEVRRPKGM